MVSDKYYVFVYAHDPSLDGHNEYYHLVNYEIVNGLQEAIDKKAMILEHHKDEEYDVEIMPCWE